MLRSYAYHLTFLMMLITISLISFLPNYNALPPIASLSDHLNHFIAFFTLSFFLIHGIKLSTQLTLFYMFIYGTAIECFQYFLPNRVFGLDDIVFDTLGILFFILLYQRIKR
ncbi:MAG: VanZ family protein [Campylobacterota bacterium]|nr:VanZ family protein [Campylobacterota bacterium]